jgi:hypothetical protein
LLVATKLKITYNDGREVQVIASPRAQVETERHFGGFNEAREIEASFYLAWASLRWAGKEPAEFDAWLDLIGDVEQVEPTELTEADEELASG